MKKLLVIFLFGIVAMFLIDKLWPEKSDTINYDEYLKSLENESSNKTDNKEMSKSDKLLDSLNQVYKKKGFNSVCEVSADLDSLLLVADFISEICLGKTYDEEYNKLRDRVLIEKTKEYLENHKLNRKRVNDDLIQLALEYPNPCSDYFNKRYKIYKHKIRNDLSYQIHQEAYRKYK